MTLFKLIRPKILILWLNYIAAISLLLSVFAGYISPATFWPLAFLGIAYPVLLIINIVFIILWAVQMRWWVLISGLAILASLPNLSNNLHLQYSTHEASNSDIKIMDYNCMLFDLYNWSHNKESRKLIFESIQKETPDILCLQEFYTSEGKNDFHNADTLISFLKTKYIHTEYTTTLRQTDHWGVATLSKYPIIRKGAIRFDTKSNNICIYTDVLIHSDTVRIYNLHLASISFGKKEYKFLDDISNKQYNDTNLHESKNIFNRLKKGFIERAKQVELVKMHIKDCPYKIILCGDFNDTPSSYAYHTLASGLKDSFLEAGNGIGKTYHGVLPFLRIDYILYSPSFSCFNYKRQPETLTDHYPISCYLRAAKDY